MGDNKFISAFVNEMYAILLGIGIGNVLFIQKLDLSSIFEISMGLFVTAVILIYWWDWTDFISENVISSKSEFILDFLILIALEILFLVYNQPQKLALVFLVLSTLDFFWVINYIRQKSDAFIANSKKWLYEKVLGISLYAASYAVLFFFLSEHAFLLQGGVVILAYVLVRKLSFRETKQSSGYDLIRANTAHFKAISAINNAHLNPEGKKSFMISSLSIDSITERVQNGHEFFVLVSRNESNVLGFVELSTSVDKEILEEVSWILEDDKERILNPDVPVRYIEKVGVSEEFTGKGIGKAIYAQLFEEFPNYSFYAFVMVSPHRNSISEQFHKSARFQVSGLFKADEYGNFEGYESLLFFRNKKGAN